MSRLADEAAYFGAHQDGVDLQQELIEELKQQLADMTADRDSWEAQADERVKGCEMFINQLAAFKADAARYRWLRVRDSGKSLAIAEWSEEDGDWIALGFKPEDIDAAIDKELEK